MVEQKRIELHKKAAEASEKEAEENRETVKSNKELLDSYQKVYQQYKEGQDVKSDLNQITKEITENYDLEGAAVARLTGKYEGLNEEIEKARDNEINDLIEKEQDNIEKQQITMVDAARLGLIDNTYLLGGRLISTGINGGIKDQVGRQISQDIFGNQSGSFNINANSQEELFDLYDKLTEATNRLSDIYGSSVSENQLYAYYSKLLDAMKPAYDSIQTSQSSINSLISEREQRKFFTDITNQNDFNQAAENFKASLIKSGVAEEIADDLVTEALTRMAVEDNNSFADVYLGSSNPSDNRYLEAVNNTSRSIGGALPLLKVASSLSNGETPSEDDYKALTSALAQLEALYVGNKTALED